MKKFVVVLLTVVLGIALLCLAAPQKLTNQTGAPASGVTVTLSEAVQITSYDKSVFPSQSPASGESESFTFSGGTLPAGGTFQVTWSPSSARVRSSQWITSGSAAAAAASTHAVTTHRGVCINPDLVLEGDIDILANDWNVNLVRILLGVNSWGSPPCATGDGWPSWC